MRDGARRSAVAGLGVAFLVLFVLGAAAQAGTSSHPLQTGFMDNRLFWSPNMSLGFQRATEAGATIARLRLNWDEIAATRPSNPVDPSDPAYYWSVADAQILDAARAGQAVMANIFASAPPAWATNASGWPAAFADPQAVGDFALAAATRYDGTHYDSSGHLLPRVKYWEIWDEPNLGLYVEPQFLNGQPIAAIWYRAVLGAASAALKSVYADNFVIAGSTAPYFDQTASTMAVNPTWGPLGFMRAVLCLTPQLTVNTSEPGCPKPVPLDAWAHHPYTEGGPTHTATLADDVELGDLPKMKATLDAAWSLGTISAAAAPELWMTEFSWNSNPPDPGGIPMTLLERWIAEGMYDMWRDGVSVLIWFQLLDGPPFEQTGFYTDATALANDQPKPSLEAFRFPFVAYPAAGGITFWGRTPAGVQATVAVQQDDGAGGWTTLGQVTSDENGIFEGSLPTSSQRDLLARLSTGEASVPFSLTPVPDQFYPSFGKFQFEPPETTLGSAPSGTVASQSASFAFSSTSSSTFACSLDGGAFAACTSPAVYDGLAAGTHSFAVRAVGLGGITDPSPATATWTVAAPQPSPPPGGGGGSSGGGDGGGGGGGLAADLSVQGSVSAPTATAGDTLTWTIRVLDANLGPAVDAYVDLQLSNNLTYVSSSTTRGPGCTYSAPTVHCFLDWMSGDASSATITVTTSVASTGDYSVTATAGELIPDSNTGNNTGVVKASAPQAPPPSPPPPPSRPVKPIIGNAVSTPTKARAGKRLTVRFRVTRSDTGKPLMTGKMAGGPSLNGKVIQHSASFSDGNCMLAFTIPKSAKGKLLRLRVTIRYNGQRASKILSLRVR